MDVTCLRSDTGNFAIEAGIFVHNSDAAAGCYINAINSEEKITMVSQNAPVMYYEGSPNDTGPVSDLITIPVPAKSYQIAVKMQCIRG